MPLRIVSGTHKGRTIHAPKNLPIRPTTDFAKESLFNILNNSFDFEGLKVLDLFTGSGGIAYEFCSRGAGCVTAVDSNFKCFSFVKETADKFGFKMLKAIKADVFAFLKNEISTYDIVFADPPYDLEKLESIPAMVLGQKLLKPGGRLIVEHSTKTDLTKQEQFLEKRVYGNTVFSIFGYKNEE
jgi:16S rRNA (guanine966-N2)-methyltransferase